MEPLARVLLRLLCLAAVLALADSAAGPLLALPAPAKETQIEVFTRGEGGYACIKIPYILATRNGTLLAFGEARHESCGDYAGTDLVWKRSTDGGSTWGPLGVVFSNSSVARNESNVIGNAAPVQDRHTGRILLPFCRNNAEVLLTHSDDDGKSWVLPPRNLTDVAIWPEWKWVGLGPPAGLQLASGRILIPAYHTLFHDLDGTFSHLHNMVSDDLGATWRIDWVSRGDHMIFANECQAVELFANNTVLVVARTLHLHHAKAMSWDGGHFFNPIELIPELEQPRDGCEGSTILHPHTGWLFYSSISEDSLLGLRRNMTLWVSKDHSDSWQLVKVIDSGPAAYSALTLLPDGSIGLLYEWAEKMRLVFLPDHTSFLVVMTPSEIEALRHIG
eukprot:m.303703 g.303703  ORF g.303703 m.303703 type:complete len:390 (-) comp16122_c0_seq1:124-1293(-)